MIGLNSSFVSVEASEIGTHQRKAFTLVELLVVIGIIALLVGVLLPALSNARRQAGAVKCAASLREIGNAFQMYAMDNHGFFPPCRLFAGAFTPKYNIDGVDFDPANTPPYWTNFLQKYVTKSKLGYGAGTNSSDAAQAQKSVFWGCPAWDGYTRPVDTGGIAITQTGYGMNGFPDFSASYPPANVELGESSGAPYDSEVNTPRYKGPGWSNFTNHWYKQKDYSHPAERALVADGLFWFLEARPPLTPPQMAGQFTLSNGAGSSNVWAAADGTHGTTFDWYRHGKYPKKSAPDEFAPNGGKVAFNVLFCDGHVSTLTDQGSSYKVVRMKYPG